MTDRWGNDDHELADLLGAYALDAVDAAEREAVERHLVDCPRCRDEAAAHREVAALLGQTTEAAPAGVWDRIAAELSPPAPPLRLAVASNGGDEPRRGILPAGGAVADGATGPSAPGGLRRWAAVVAVAASLLAAAGIGAVAVDRDRQLDRMEQAVESRSIDDMAAQAARDADLTVTLSGGSSTAEAVVDRNGRGYLMAAGLPDLDRAHVYQLWGKVDGTMLSLGTFGSGTEVVPFTVDADRIGLVEMFAVTMESAPGVATSDQAPMLVGEA